MIFINNKYTTTYFKIISKARARNLVTDYTEKHHIIPRSLGGDNSLSNLVKLTAREHFICHWLLTKMVSAPKEKFKLFKAFNCMSYLQKPGQERYRISGRAFENIRENYSKIFSEQMKGENNPMFGKDVSAETRKKISIASSKYKATPETRKKISAALKGRTFSEETRDKISNANKGKLAGTSNPMYGRTHSDESRKKISDNAKGKTAWNRGIAHSTDTKLLLSKKAKNREQKVCTYCTKTCDASNYARWHGENCKNKNQNL